MNSKSISVLMFSAILFLLAFVSCKESSTENSGLFQTTRVYRTQNHLVSPAELAIVQMLFQKNKLSLSNLQVYRLVVHKGTYIVRCYQFYNGLELFTEDVVFSFDQQNIVYSIMNDLITRMDVHWEPMVSEKDAGDLFYKEILKDYNSRNILNSGDKLVFYAQLGYYDLNVDTSNNFILAWKLNVASSPKYPVAYIRADTLRLINYSNGIIFG